MEKNKEKSSEKDLNYCIDEILSILKSKPLFNINNDCGLTRPIENDDIEEILKVRLKGGGRTNNVFDFLDDHNPDEMNFYDDAEKAIWGHQNFNPREMHKFKEYFVPKMLRKFM